MSTLYPADDTGLLTTDEAEASASSGMERPDHPLAQLTAAEIERVKQTLVTAGLFVETTRVAYLGLEESPKREVLDWTPGSPIERRARAQIIDLATGASAEVVVSITGGVVVSNHPIDPVHEGHVPFLSEEHEAVRLILLEHEGWRKALADRGITDMETIAVGALSAGRYGDIGEGSRRIAMAVPNLQPTPTSMPWAYPIDGLVAYVDLIDRSVVEIIDTGALPIPEEQGDYHLPGAFGPERTTQKPIVITQPEGPSFAVDGNLVTWEKWSFRVGYDMREGLVLHQLGFDDDGVTRPIVYRASVGEMVVPYGDPSPVRFWQNYFDTGEYQLGNLVNSLDNGCDCVGEIRYFDAIVAGSDGEPRIVKNAVCLHEEDAGILWKHTDEAANSSDTRRQRRLVISFFVTVGNYDYGFYWNLYLDGTIQLEVKATGIVFTSAYDERGSAFASELAPGLAAPYHQHLFNARLDMMVDGELNAVDEVDVVPVGMSESNPWGNAIAHSATRLTTEREGQRIANNNVDRTWAISNPAKTNRFGQPVSYVLFPEGKQLLAAATESAIAQRAAFATKHLWVTQYAADERYPAGDFVNQSVGGRGLPAYVEQDRNIDTADLVLWHTFGLTHFPRTEDWPIMPVDTSGFVLKPTNFFDRNPTLDVPMTMSADAHCAHDTGHDAGHDAGH